MPPYQLKNFLATKTRAKFQEMSKNVILSLKSLGRSK